MKRDNKDTKLREIYKAGEKYHCAGCGSEVQFLNSYPTGKNEINWAYIRFIARPY